MIAPAPSALSLPLRTPRVTARPPVCPPADLSERFTLDGSDDLERHLAVTCRKIAAGVRGIVSAGRLEALLLGGGYGRGEGGVLRADSGDRPYNDLEFYVFLRGNRHLNERRFGRALHVLGEILTPQAGLEVEFKIVSRREFERSPVSMFSYDLAVGHRCFAGSADVLARCAHHREAARLPLAEATRLLMNRCSGLLFAKERLARKVFTAADADFVRRNIAKAQLALGDALLVAAGAYHWSVRSRADALVRLPRDASMAWMPEVLRHHAEGVAFKLHPERSEATREELLALHAPVVALAGRVWLWIEQRRLGPGFESAAAYAQSRIDKCPETARLRNALLNARRLGLRACAGPRALRHPRERIFHALALLLWEPATLLHPALLARVQRELQTPASDFPGLMDAYRALWSQVN